MSGGHGLDGGDGGDGDVRLMRSGHAVLMAESRRQRNRLDAFV